MKIDDNLILAASKALEDTEIVSKGRFPKEFRGYISSLGAAIAQSGLLPAILFYESVSEKTAADREKVPSAIRSIMVTYYKIDIPNNNMAMSNYILSKCKDRAEINNLGKKIVEAATALKIALRLYEVNS